MATIILLLFSTLDVVPPVGGRMTLSDTNFKNKRVIAIPTFGQQFQTFMSFMLQIEEETVQ